MEAASVHAPVRLHRVSVPLLRLRSDDQLVALFRQGHEDAFQVIHERYRQRLFAYSRQMLAGSRSDAEDAMQDVFLRAYGALRADDRPVTLRAWLYRVAHNRCIDQLRRPMPAAVDLFDLTRGPSLLDPLEQAERREDLARLVSDVRRLPEQQRSALLMREMEGLTYKELSDALGVSIPAVKSLLVRARIGLVEAIEARNVACGEIREDIAGAVDRGVRSSGRARRHMRDCAGCREYRTAMRGELKQLNGLGGGNGMLAAAAKLLGIGGAGSSAAASGGAAGSGAAVIGGGAVATKVAVLACCAVVVGGTVEANHATQAEQHARSHTPAPATPATARAAPALGLIPITHVADPLAMAHRTAVAKPSERATRVSAPAAPPAAAATPAPADSQPASDSPVVDQATGGLLAPDDGTDAGDTDATTTGTGTQTSTVSDASQGTSSSTSGASTSTSSSSSQGAANGPDGGPTGSAPPTAQGATAPGATPKPS